ncbi:cysteine-rich and transmembrane domain-containing protein 1-like [Nerophis ophidion]|uniref:cysteine-rich and transmembrane domain-containing protein 1-like n=1 Tax=Nerophis ophidion TaxID=159077 RepID=UPI002AE0666B|nr:cysteine-rich and transmembrane domain-containing protein 1-like [Nerophis ophidion]XP_061746158.1 cysteine-rich and transmembrane domain-containing protein 1-like [Nerophis ophidion]
MSAHPPPYAPPPPAPDLSPPGTYPSLPYQAADPSYYHYGTPPPGYQNNYYGGPSGHPLSWDAPKPYGVPPKHTVYVVDDNQEARHGGGTLKSCLSACSTVLCCCCIWDLLTRNFC